MGFNFLTKIKTLSKLDIAAEKLPWDKNKVADS